MQASRYMQNCIYNVICRENIAFKRALVFRCCYEYFLPIKGASRIIFQFPEHKKGIIKPTGVQSVLPSSAFQYSQSQYLCRISALTCHLIVDMTPLFISATNHHKLNSEAVDLVNSWSSAAAKVFGAVSALERWKQETVSVILTGTSCKPPHVHNMPHMMSLVFWCLYFTVISPSTSCASYRLALYRELNLNYNLEFFFNGASDVCLHMRRAYASAKSVQAKEIYIYIDK